VQIAKYGETVSQIQCRRESAVVLKTPLRRCTTMAYNRAKIAGELNLPTTEIEYLLSDLRMTLIQDGERRSSNQQRGQTVPAVNGFT